MNNKQCHDVQKNATSYCEFRYEEYTQVLAKNMLMISKKDMINKTLQNIGQMQ